MSKTKCGRKEKRQKVWKWLRKNVFNKEMIVYVLVAEVIFWSPCIVTGFLGIFVNAWWWTAFGAICAFWAGPFTPAVALQIALAIAIKKLWERRMKVNTNISLRDRHIVTAKDFKGLNTLSPTIEVDAMHSTDMSNLISRDGVNHKRYGWETLCRLRKDGKDVPIRSVFNFELNGDKFFIVYANKTFYSVVETNGKYEFIEILGKQYAPSDNAVLDGSVLELKLQDTECKCFVSNDKAYFIGCGDYLVFEVNQPIGATKYYQFKRVQGDNAYLPTTTINITPEEKRYTERITFEDKNILNRLHKNTMFGINTENHSSLTYFLDERNLLVGEDGYPITQVVVNSKYGYIDLKESNEEELKQNQIGGVFFDANIKLGEKEFTFTESANLYTKTSGYIVFEKKEEKGVVKLIFKDKNQEPNEFVSYPTMAKMYTYKLGIDGYNKDKVGYYIESNGVLGYISKIEGYNAYITFLTKEDFGIFYGDAQQNQIEELKIYSGEQKQHKTEFVSGASKWMLPNLDLVEFTDGSKLQIVLTTTEYQTEKLVLPQIDEFVVEKPIKMQGEVVLVAKSDVVKSFGNFDIAYEITDHVVFRDGDRASLYMKIKILSYLHEYTDKNGDIKTTEYLTDTITNETIRVATDEKTSKEFVWGEYYIAQVGIRNFICEKEYENKKLTFIANIDAKKGRVQFFPVQDEEKTYYHDAYEPEDSGKNNIEITILGKEGATKGFRVNEFKNSYDGIKFGLEGADDRLFLVSNEGNAIYWSKDLDFTYFGENSWLTCGTDDTKIISIEKLNDSTLIVAKEYSDKENSLFTIKGKMLTEKTESDTTDYKVVFSPQGYKLGKEIVGDLTNLNGDCLALTKDGVSAISIGENNTLDSRYIVPRAKQISNELSKYDLSKAKCIAHEDKFYLAIDNMVFVADGKQIYQYGGSNNYEWYKWENFPCNAWMVLDNELHFITEDGQICRFTENFYDTEKRSLSKESIFYETKDLDIIGIGISNELKQEVGDYITFDCDMWGGYETTEWGIVGEQLRIYIPNEDITNGEQVYLGEDIAEVDIDASTLYKQDDYVYIMNSVTNPTESGKLAIVRNYKGKKLRVKEVIRGEDYNYFVLEDANNNVIAWSRTESNNGLNLAQTELALTWERQTPIVARWVSGMMDLGNNTHLKTITSIAIVGEKDLANRVSYGIATRFNESIYKLLRANNDLDLEKLDLSTISLDSSFASTYVKKLNIRNVNYIMFYYISQEAEDVSINSYEVEYKIIKKIIGAK